MSGKTKRDAAGRSGSPVASRPQSGILLPTYQGRQAAAANGIWRKGTFSSTCRGTGLCWNSVLKNVICTHAWLWRADSLLLIKHLFFWEVWHGRAPTICRRFCSSKICWIVHRRRQALLARFIFWGVLAALPGAGGDLLQWEGGMRMEVRDRALLLHTDTERRRRIF